MARLQEIPSLSIIIPTLNEANKLPLLLADLNTWNDNLELIVVDGGSKDSTVSIAKIHDILVIESLQKNRGYQLNIGASHAKGDWLLFLHADSRLDKIWIKKLIAITRKISSKDFAWYFDFKIENANLQFRILEIAVALRSYLFNRPYGDQGLLIHKSLYNLSGGFSSLNIMEDLDLMIRITKTNKVKSIGANIYTDSKKWANSNILERAIKNAILRYKWTQGYDIERLSNEYYSQ